MGGAEMFTNNKVQFLLNHGWVVDVFFCLAGKKILLNYLTDFSRNRIPELGYSFSAFSRKKRNKIISRISEGFSDYNEIVIESHLIHLAHWGEIIAKRIGAKHILNCMEERMSVATKEERAFVEFKLKRHEILNAVNTNVLRRYFGSYVKSDYENYLHNYLGKPICSNVTADINYDVSYIDKGAYNIISVGRLDKPYIETTFRCLKTFAMKHPEQKLNILVIGGSPDGRVEKRIEDLFSTCLNVKIYNHGYMFPIPLTLLKIANLGIAAANSVDVLTMADIPTINIDIRDLKPIGLYGITTTNKFERTEEDGNRKLADLLEFALLNKQTLKIDHSSIDESNNIENIFNRQLEFIKLNTDKEYFDIQSRFPISRYIRYKLSRILPHICMLKEI